MATLSPDATAPGVITAEQERLELLATCDRLIAESQTLSAESARTLLRQRSAATSIFQPLGPTKPR